LREYLLLGIQPLQLPETVGYDYVVPDNVGMAPFHMNLFPVFPQGRLGGTDIDPIRIQKRNHGVAAGVILKFRQYILEIPIDADEHSVRKAAPGKLVAETAFRPKARDFMV
jgi:hypothetical protein